MKKIATLKHNGMIYNYFESDEDDDFTVTRIDENGSTYKNPYWDYDILTDDIVDSEIIYLYDLYADYYISENDFHELWDMLYKENKIPYNSAEIVSKIKAYIGGENNA